MSILRKIIGKKSAIAPKTETVPEHYPFTQWRVFGSPAYGIAENDPEVVFVDKNTGERKKIIDENRAIVNFPGIENEDRLKNRLGDGSLRPQVSFGAYFRKESDGKYIMEWTVQPDGMFWNDESGFGGNSDQEIVLYAPIDAKGNFTAPFRIYSIGGKRYDTEAEQR